MFKQVQFRGVSEDGQINCLPLLGYTPSSVLEKTAAASPSNLHPAVKNFVRAVRPTPEGIYVLVNALGAGEYWGSNVNGDLFPEAALIHAPPEWDSLSSKDMKEVGKKWDYGFPTFMNAYPYKHHVNKDPSRAFGEVVLAVWNPKMHRVELIVYLDRAKCKKWGAYDVIERIERGEFPDVSMGCKVPFDICTICDHKSKTRKDYCDHALKQMNKILPDGRKVAVRNDNPRFFDISFVFIGADKSAKVLAKLAQKNDQVCMGDFCSIPRLSTDVADSFTSKQAQVLASVDPLEAMFTKTAAVKEAVSDEPAKQLIKIKNKFTKRTMLRKQAVSDELMWKVTKPFRDAQQGGAKLPPEMIKRLKKISDRVNQDHPSDANLPYKMKGSWKRNRLVRYLHRDAKQLGPEIDEWRNSFEAKAALRANRERLGISQPKPKPKPAAQVDSARKTPIVTTPKPKPQPTAAAKPVSTTVARSAQAAGKAPSFLARHGKKILGAGVGGTAIGAGMYGLHKAFNKEAEACSCGGVCDPDFDKFASALFPGVNLKSASQSKLSEIIKDVPAGPFFEKDLPKVESSEEDLPPHVLDLLAKHPLGEALAAPSSLGIVLKPREFQRIILIQMGERPLADGLDSMGKVFGNTNEIDPIQMSPLGGNGDLLKLLLPFLAARSCATPLLSKRISIIARSKPKGSSPTPISGDEVMDKMAALYNGYRQDLVKKAGVLEKNLSTDPQLLGSIAGGSIVQAFGGGFGKSANASVLGPEALAYLVGAHYQDRDFHANSLTQSGAAAVI